MITPAHLATLAAAAAEKIDGLERQLAELRADRDQWKARAETAERTEVDT